MTLYENCLKESFSFEGEDRLCLSLLRGIIGNFDGDIFYMDIGCNDPFKNNNTYLFYKLGYKGICIDPLPESKKKFNKHREKDIFFNVAITDKEEEKDMQVYKDKIISLLTEVYDGASTLDEKTKKEYSFKFEEKEVIRVKTKTLKNIFKAMDLKDKIDIPLLSIDVEGFDEIVFKQALEINHNFEVIVVEDKYFNLTRKFPQSEISKIAHKYGYILIAKTLLNSIYIRTTSDIFNWIPNSMRTYNIK